MTGWSCEEASGRMLTDVFHLIDGDTLLTIQAGLTRDRFRSTDVFTSSGTRNRLSSPTQRGDFDGKRELAPRRRMAQELQLRVRLSVRFQRATHPRGLQGPAGHARHERPLQRHPA